MLELFGEGQECFSSDILVAPCISNPLQDKNVPLSPKKQQHLSPEMDNSTITYVPQQILVLLVNSEPPRGADAFIFP